MKKLIFVSECCSGKVIAEYDNSNKELYREETFHYICDKCNKECEVMSELSA